jgi:ectoine hydroxylase-related dioxygenase (phytanoyl-CoA dioxygenase family)
VWITLDDIDHDNGAMAVVPRWHTKGKLPVQDSQIAVGFTQEIRPDALPANVEELKVEYLIRAGQAALHHVMIPHNSPPNVADRWRRVLVLRYIEAGGEFGPNQYTNYRTGEPFAREFLLVRGRDVSGLGLRRSPFD